MASSYSFSQRMMLAIAPRLASLIIRLIGITLRYDDVFEPGVAPGHLQAQGIFCFWHQCMLGCAWRFRNLGIAILISRSFDGELIARTVERLGFIPIRGSSSRGGVAGLRGMEQAYRAGHHCAFTSDGPRGPVYVAKPGVTMLAQTVGSDVGVFHVLPQRAWRLKSWDSFMIPKPFSRVVFAWTQHVDVPADTTAEEFAETHARVQAALDRARAMAEEHIHAPRAI